MTLPEIEREVIDRAEAWHHATTRDPASLGEAIRELIDAVRRLKLVKEALVENRSEQ